MKSLSQIDLEHQFVLRHGINDKQTCSSKQRTSTCESPPERSRSLQPIPSPQSARLLPRRSKLKAAVPTVEELKQRQQHLESLISRAEIDYISGNARSIRKIQPPKTKTDVKFPQLHKSFGKVPPYLLTRQEEWALEEEKRKENQLDPNCPPGMKLMSEFERVETLRVLKQAEEEAKRQWQSLSIIANTPGQTRRRNQLENRLHELESALKIFDRSKVYIPIQDN